MSKEEIIKGNKIIAEFMELKQVKWRNDLIWVNKNFIEDFTDVDDYSDKSKFDWGNSLPQSENLYYSSSWDWLIPVINKIYSSDWYFKWKDTSGQFEKEIFINTKYIDATWCQVVEFIKWYNSCQKEK